MKSAIISFFMALCFALGFSLEAGAKPEIAFGFLSNNSKDRNYDYLETIFPNSFANSIKNIFEVNVIKPTALQEKLQKDRLELKKYYNPYELPELMEKIGSDLFIYGKFTPLPDNQIRIVINLYSEKAGNIFTFTNVGKMETEIFRLVDRITVILLNYMANDELYLAKPIPSGVRLAFLTDVSGEELNELSQPFLEKGYSVSSAQGDSIYNRFTIDDMAPLYNIRTRNNSYDLITDRRKVNLLYGTWAGSRYSRDLRILRKTYLKYDQNFLKTKEALLDRLDRTFNRTIDYVVIVGFKKNRKKAWVRCIDLKNRDLVWMQTNISGSGVSEIATRMIERMSTPVKDPFKEKIEKYK